ncbi:uncharacterized protein LOC121432171 [Lytechinus variegatus]|uniref:uncharacterized protein LOC121432171 n=1 Tax=Lytechinus variegatus TaxID=7654 RepID=UPI001BB1FC36|nr:uncharacterized protein LOC121432171 [Lytechinus variegatus]
MENEPDQEAQEASTTDADAGDSNQERISSFFSKIKQRAMNSLRCSSANVISVNHPGTPGDVPFQQTENGAMSSSGSTTSIYRAGGIVDLKMESLDVIKVKEADEHGVETYEIIEDYDPKVIELTDDDIWEENMWNKMYSMVKGRKPIDFRLYLVDMIRFSAKIDDLKSMGIYLTKLQQEYSIYNYQEKQACKDRSRSRGKLKFRVDGLVEELILRLCSLQVGPEVNWKRMVNIICDRLKKNMEPKQKPDIEELPKILFPGRAKTMKDVSDSWFIYSTLDLTGYDLQGDPDAEELRRRLGVFLSLRPLVLVKLNLSYTGLDKKNFLPLLPHIAQLPALQELDLRGNRLDASVIKHFYPYLGKFGDRFRSGFPSIRWVYFNHNYNISRLPVHFLVGINRRWPAIEHRPTPQELTESRATVCDFSIIEMVQAKLNEKRAELLKMARLKHESRDAKDKKKAAFVRRVALAAKKMLIDEGLIEEVSPPSSPSELDHVSERSHADVDRSDAGRQGRSTRRGQVVQAAGVAAAGNQDVANNQNAQQGNLERENAHAVVNDYQLVGAAGALIAGPDSVQRRSEDEGLQNLTGDQDAAQENDQIHHSGAYVYRVIPRH